MAINNCTFMGRLTDDPKSGTTQSDISWCRFTIACDRAYTKKDEKPPTDFIDCTAWRATADFIVKYFHKGDMIAVQGPMQTGVYEKDGVKRKSCECVIQQASFTGSKRDKSSEPANNAPEGFENLDEDIPF